MNKTNTPPALMAQAVETLQKGGLVAFPTETVYGLGADARNEQAVAAIYAAKQRPSFNPLIIHIASQAQAEKLGIFNAVAQKLAAHFWAGALTLVVPRQPDCPISTLACAGLDSVALRIPAHPLARQLLQESGLPLAAPSANPSGGLSPTQADHVRKAWPDMLVLDGGACSIGLESTIIGCLDDQPVLLRTGALARENIEAVLGQSLTELPDEQNQTARLAPGRLAQHYAPQAQLRLNVQHVNDDEALLAFGDTLPAHKNICLNLSPSGDMAEAAANLFAHLHTLDKSTDKIAVMPIPHSGLGEAINDRLSRAAAPFTPRPAPLAGG